MSGRPDRLTERALVGLAGYLIGLSVLMVVSPATFHTDIAPFGPRNDHGIRDAATFQFILGLAAIRARARPSWRTSVLFALGLQFALHALNHLADINEAHPGSLGPADFAGLAFGALSLFLLAWRAQRHNRSAAENPR